MSDLHKMFQVTREIISRIVKKWDLDQRGKEEAMDRFEQFEDFLKTHPSPEEINTFFNNEHFVEYRTEKKDHWQTLAETIVRGAGDCEDIAIAKYTTLRLLEWSDKKLRLVHGTLKRSFFRGGDRAHMVLFVKLRHNTFYVLDNTTSAIKKWKEREDLDLNYAVNFSGFWWKKRDRFVSYGSADRVAEWKTLKERAHQMYV